MLSPRKHDGFERSLLPILAEHARPVIARGLYERQTVAAGVEVLKAAVRTYGVPWPLVCGHGSPLPCRALRRVWAMIEVAVADAPPPDPQSKGKSERFFRTARREMPRAQGPEMATGLHARWIEEENHHRSHRRVTDAAGHAHAPGLRWRWQPSAARPLPPGIHVDDVFQGQRPPPGPRPRPVKAARGIRSRKQSSQFPARHKGKVIAGNEGKAQMDFASLGNVVPSRRKPLRQQTATTRKVHTGGLVKFKPQRMQLDLPKGTHAVVLREGQDSIFYLGDRVVFRINWLRVLLIGLTS